MKYQINPVTGRYEWMGDSPNPLDNTGQVGVDSSGNLTIGMGNGLGIDLKTGDLTFGVGGFSIDLNNNN